MQVITLRFTFTVHKYNYPFVIIWTIILKVQVNEPLKERGEQTGVPGENKPDKPTESRYHIIIRGKHAFTDPGGNRTLSL